MRIQICRVAICLAVVAIGCNQSTPDSAVQKPTGPKMVTDDLVFNVEGLT